MSPSACVRCSWKRGKPSEGKRKRERGGRNKEKGVAIAREDWGKGQSKEREMKLEA